MFVGHFGVAAAVKAKSPETPLWSLMVATQLIDIIFAPLFFAGIETMVNVTGKVYGGDIIYAFYTHSLTWTLILSVLAGLLASRFWGRRGGLIIGAVVFSHWLLDLLVHRPDLPILPGNFGSLPLLGLGLWNYTAVTAIIEACLVLAGFFMYIKSVLARNNNRYKIINISSGLITGILLMGFLVLSIMG